ncbi:MAG: Hpt domain-containing protein, partial [Ruminiclostridium sp.]|nr:Hpt domain-containing protein [Ruminiclostridium sp.]
PEETIEYVTDDDESSSDGESAEKDYYDTLRSVGIEPKTGLKFCQDDESFYRALLAEYAYGELEKAHNLQKSFETENWHDYSIYVHSLKSSSKMIGASALSMRAAKLEAAANSVDSGTIHAEHGSMMEEYELMTAVVRSVIPKTALDPDDDNVTEYSPSDDIMEFLPGGDDTE